MAGAFQSDAFQNDAFQVDGGTSSSASDSVTTSDAATRTGLFSRTASDAITISDVATALINNRATADAVTLSDVATRTVSLFRTATQTVTLSDAVTKAAGHVHSTHDHVSLYDVPTIPIDAGGTIPGVVTITIKIAGVNVTNAVVYDDAEFISRVNGIAGSCSFRVRDDGHTYNNFTTGQSITLDVEGRRQWGGYINQVTREYAFPVDITTIPASTERFWAIQGVDYNILFTKRFYLNKLSPTRPLPNYAKGTFDSTIIFDQVSNFLDLSSDGLSIAGVLHVGTPVPDMKGNLGAPGDSWATGMDLIIRYTGAVYFIDPDKVLNHLDSKIANTSYYLTDTPGGDSFAVGYRDLEVINNGSDMANDALVWGAGQGTKSTNFRRVSDNASISLHHRWQVGEFDFNLYTGTALTNRATTLVYGSPQNKRGAKDDAVSWKLTVFRPVFRAGDVTTVDCHVFTRGSNQDPPFDNVALLRQTNVPIRQVEMTFPTPHAVKFDLTIGHDIDQPWMGYEYWFPPFPDSSIGDITVPGISSQPVENDCEIITDTYTRSVSGGTSTGFPTITGSWGTTDTGQIWSYTDVYSSPPSQGSSNIDFSVNGTTGVVVITDPSEFIVFGNQIFSILRHDIWTAEATLTYFDPNNPSTENIGDPTVSITLVNSGSDRSEVEVLLASGSPGLFTQFLVRVRDPSTPAQDVFQSLTLPTPFADTTPFHLKLGADPNGGRGKIWIDGDPEPDWMIDFSGVTGGEIWDTFLILFEEDGRPTNAVTWHIDNVQLRGCTLVPTGGQTCESFPGGSTVYTVSNSYLDGSPSVFVDGALLTASEYTETNPGTGVITLNSAPAGGSTVLICYTIAIYELAP